VKSNSESHEEGGSPRSCAKVVVEGESSVNVLRPEKRAKNVDSLHPTVPPTFIGVKDSVRVGSG
jgi:hypothetical protein